MNSVHVGDDLSPAKPDRDASANSWSWRRLIVLFVVFAGLIVWRREVLWLPPYEDQAVGLWSEADYLVENHFNYYRLRYDEPHFMEPQTGARSYMISVIPTIIAILTSLLPSIDAVVLTTHLVTFVLTTVCLAVVFDLLAPVVGRRLAFLTCAAVVTTPFFAAQVEQVGLDVPLTAFSLLSIRALQRRQFARALLFSVLAFFMKSTGMLLTLCAAAYLTASAAVLLLEGDGRRVRTRGGLAVIGFLLVAMEIGLVAWGDTTVALRLSIQWPNALSFASGLTWCPDFGILLLFAAAGALHHLVTFIQGVVASDRRRIAYCSTWLQDHAYVLVAVVVLSGLTIAMLRYIFIPRYVTLAVPLCYLVGISAWFPLREERGLRLPRGAAWSLPLALVVAFNLVNQHGRFYPSVAKLMEQSDPGLTMWHARMCAFTERSREYLQDHRSALRAIHLLEAEHPNSTIFTDMPYAWYLTKPRLGYVRKALPNVYQTRDFGGTVEKFVDSVDQRRNGRAADPIFVFAARSRARFPDPGAFAETLYRDDGDPPLVLYQLRVDQLPQGTKSLEDWYLAQTWRDDFQAWRALDRSGYLEKSNRLARNLQEVQEALSKQPTPPFLYEYLLERQKYLKGRASK